MTSIKQSKAPDINQAAIRLLSSGRLAEARRLLEEALVTHGRELPLWLNLAIAARAMGDMEGALVALDGALRLDPRCFPALLMRGALYDQAGNLRQAAQAYGTALSQFSPNAPYDDPTVQAIARAHEVHSAYQRELEAALRQSVAGLAEGHGDAQRMSRMIDVMLGQRKVYHQRPTHYFMPGLPAIEFFDRDLFPWLPLLEGASRDIQREMATVMSDQAMAGSFQPYIHYPDWVPLDQWRPLNNSKDWSAFHLLEKGQPVPGNAERCPRTMEILAQMPQPVVPRRSPVAMFSVLKPGTHIPPHTGVANTRLVVHLPLLVPAGCVFRVGNETRKWKVGEAWVFDDTIEHEAWNNSAETRVVMIFDIWHPALTEAERQAYSRIMEAMDLYEGLPPQGGI